MTILHGIKVNEPSTGTIPISMVATNVIGLVATAPDADADTFPLGVAVLVDNIRAVIGKAGSQGTLALALSAIAAQSSPVCVVVRVAPGVAGNGETAQQQTDLNVIGGTADGVYTGLQALLSAEVVLGVRPRIIGCPGLDSQAVTTAMVPIMQRLRGFGYAAAAAADVAGAIAYRDNFGARELMLLWPDLADSTTWAGQAVATAMGLRAMLDDTQGFSKSISNVAFNGGSGLTKHVYWDLQDSNTDAGLLNSAAVTTIIRKDGFRFWGNRTCAVEGTPFVFEVATRTAQVLMDTMATGLMPFVDRPLTAALIRDAEESINTEFRLLKSKGLIIDGSCWFDASENPSATLAAGGLTLDYDYTPCAPLESLGLNQRITDKYYADLASSLS